MSQKKSNNSAGHNMEEQLFGVASTNKIFSILLQDVPPVHQLTVQHKTNQGEVLSPP